MDTIEILMRVMVARFFIADASVGPGTDESIKQSFEDIEALIEKIESEGPSVEEMADELIHELQVIWEGLV